MNGKAIRQAAREQINGRRGFLLLAVVLSNLPSWLSTQILPRFGFEVPRLLNWLVSLFCALLALGVIKIMLEQVEGKPKTFRSLFFSFSRGVFLNALILTLILGLFSLIVSATTTGMGVAGILIFAIAAMLLDLLLFPIRYRLVIYPGRPLTEHLKEGVKLGVHWCGDVIVFHLCLYGPIFLAYVFYLVLFVLLRGNLMIILILFLLALVGIVALFWYLPYATLAQAMFTKELILEEERTDPPPPPKKHMKLVKKDGWCRVDTKTGRGGKKLNVKKDGEAIERK